MEVVHSLCVRRGNILQIKQTGVWKELAAESALLPSFLLVDPSVMLLSARVSSSLRLCYSYLLFFFPSAQLRVLRLSSQRNSLGTPKSELTELKLVFDRQLQAFSSQLFCVQTSQVVTDQQSRCLRGTAALNSFQLFTSFFTLTVSREKSQKQELSWKNRRFKEQNTENYIKFKH